MSRFSIKTERFEGPLDLLIELIEKRKMLVNDVSLAQVTDDYLAHVAQLETHSLKESSQFVALAATLLLIKSRSLLPVFEVTKDEEDAIDDLEERLRIYQIYRNGAKVLTKRFGAAMLAFRSFVPDETPLFLPDSLCTPQTLREAIGRVLTDLPRGFVLPKVHIKKTVSLEEIIEQIRSRLDRQTRLRFRDFIGESGERSTTIVGFLAVLEMVRHGNVHAEQDIRFGDIEISREASSGTIPRYG
ncbi:hypothetical protein A3C87_01935 [Candidatus Kaiserbacteria bacterium RIFCSPHIGHO2_02_FULL_49_34]|uniref:Segregation and condensation protein A n=1 Tax=Candidatus Kaiserbacteria bacterium RIFCSPHIGHO2_02_FULL_49_34 TaxID=1798491 RepID=A0A1F6DI83_9BACT|nr:MAG: hypothetical protein A3C87_01935 [Candidatus Kaiserbacteria bacterium RIFCSPHIGHO2_02_FULL_49_34]